MTKKEKDKYRTADGYAYLTKRLLTSKAREAGREASKKAIDKWAISSS